MRNFYFELGIGFRVFQEPAKDRWSWLLKSAMVSYMAPSIILGPGLKWVGWCRYAQYFKA